jgi:hypothetical protein
MATPLHGRNGASGGVLERWKWEEGRGSRQLRKHAAKEEDRRNRDRDNHGYGIWIEDKK